MTQRKKENEKGVMNMTDAIGRIFGGNSYGVGGYVPQRKEDEAPQNAPAQTPALNYEETQVDPSKVMDVMNAIGNNIFAPSASVSKPAELDPACASRAAASMEDFMSFVEAAYEETGDMDLALLIADAYSDR